MPESLGQIVPVAGEVAVDAVPERCEPVQEVHGDTGNAAGFPGRAPDPRYVKRFARHCRDRIMQECRRVDATASAEMRL